MVMKLILEVIVLWICFALYMEILVRKKGPIGGIQFYPKEVQNRVISLGLITAEQMKKQTIFSMLLLIALDLVVPFLMILVINGAKTYGQCAFQYYVLFMGQELYDWLAVDVWWVAMSSWWIIPGTEDLLSLWHDPKIKFKGKLKLPMISVPLALLAGGICFGIYLLF